MHLFLQNLIFVTLYYLGQIHQISRLQQQKIRLLVLLKSLHDEITLHRLFMVLIQWLPVKYRIIYKILVITFSGLRFNQPHYIGELVHSYEPPRNRRLCHKDNLVRPHSNTICYGSKSFASAAATYGNQLSESVKSCDTLY